MAPSWKNDIKLWFQKYSFDDETMIALFQYCYEQCALHRKYIEIVAEEWSKKNIQTYEDLQKYRKEMNMNLKEMKEQAIKQMKALKLNNKIIEDYKKEDKIYKSTNIKPYIEEITKEEKKLIDDFEKKYATIVFHVINVNSQILNQYELLFVTRNKENWKDDVVDNKNGFMISNTIVINTELNKQMVNEIGIIGIENNNGGVYRVC